MLMLVGMATVFAFLGLLVVMMHAQAWVLARVPVSFQPTSGLDDLALVAVALAAIEAHQRGDT